MNKKNRLNLDELKKITLSNHQLLVSILPELGGSISEFKANLRNQDNSSNWIHIMTPTKKTFSSPWETSSFLMAPYPNRIRDGQFVFNNKSYQLEKKETHALHGDVCARAWNVTKQNKDNCSLEFSSIAYPDINFPFPFSMKQNIKLKTQSLLLECSIKNEHSSTIPVGFGFHPYFRRSLIENVSTESSQLPLISFNSSGHYTCEGNVPLPLNMQIKKNEQLNFSSAKPLVENLDHCFADWDGKATIFWPDLNKSLTMSTSKNLGHLVIYSPENQNFFAFEPQSQMIDGFNFFKDNGDSTGVIALEPLSEIKAWIELEIS